MEQTNGINQRIGRREKGPLFLSRRSEEASLNTSPTSADRDILLQNGLESKLFFVHILFFCFFFDA